MFSFMIRMNSLKVIWKSSIIVSIFLLLSSRCISIPGHSPGSICYYFPNIDLVCCGDVLFKRSVGRTEYIPFLLWLYASWSSVPSLDGTGDFDQLITGIKTKLLVRIFLSPLYRRHCQERWISSLVMEITPLLATKSSTILMLEITNFPHSFVNKTNTKQNA